MKVSAGFSHVFAHELRIQLAIVLSSRLYNLDMNSVGYKRFGNSDTKRFFMMMANEVVID